MSELATSIPEEFAVMKAPRVDLEGEVETPTSGTIYLFYRKDTTYRFDAEQDGSVTPLEIDQQHTWDLIRAAHNAVETMPELPDFLEKALNLGQTSEAPVSLDL